MPAITFDMPDGALAALRASPADVGREIRAAAAIFWYSRGEVSQSIGAARVR